MRGAAEPSPTWRGLTVYTIGHSTRTQEELLALLHEAKITSLADLRSYPRSRHNPQFNKDTLQELLPSNGIRYEHVKTLGGRRRGIGEASPNKGWRSEAFRGFADYMLTEDFAAGLEELRGLAVQAKEEGGGLAILCAEAVPWRCHRSLVSDTIVIHGGEVFHLINPGHPQTHRLTRFAKVEGERITYPPMES